VAKEILSRADAGRAATKKARAANARFNIDCLA
jgi:hypothetical protein